MSALNVFVRGDAAHVITDGAFYHPDGRVLHICSKVARAPSFHAVVASTGRADQERVADAFRDAGPRSQADVVRLLPEIANSLAIANEAACPGDGDSNGLQLVLALFYLEHRSPRAFMVSTNRAWFGPDFEPNKLHEIEDISVPRVPIPADFDPRRDGESLLEAQRGVTDWASSATPHVGGFGERHSVSAAGVERVELVRWPDVVGEKIRVAD